MVMVVVVRCSVVVVVVTVVVLVVVVVVVLIVAFLLKMCFGHNGVHFFNIATSKSRPRMVCFCYFLLPNLLALFSTSQLVQAV